MISNAAKTAAILAPLISFSITPTYAQTVAGGDLRTQQEALFEAMLQAPDDLEIMFNHALVSIELQDFEAAISTLERMLIFNPGLNRAKVELGAAYFKLGAYENARFYFEDALASGDAPPEVEGRISRFLDEIDKRTAKTGFFGVATVGVTYSSNANLGPSDSEILLNSEVAQLADEFIASQDIGVRASVYGSHFYDLDQPDGDLWQTDATFFSVHYLDETAGDIDTIQLRTGPRLSLDNENFGPKLRPFLELDGLRSNNETLYATIGGGVEYTDTINERTNIFASFHTAWREYFQGRNEFDGSTHNLLVGARYGVNKNFGIIGSIYGETDQTRVAANTNYEVGARLNASYNYDSGFDFTDRLWSLSGYAQVAYRKYDEPDPQFDTNIKRRDYDFRAGVSHVFHFREGWFAQADADFLLRDSNIPNFDIDSIGVTMSIGRSF